MQSIAGITDVHDSGFGFWPEITDVGESTLGSPALCFHGPDTDKLGHWSRLQMPVLLILMEGFSYLSHETPAPAA